MAYWKRKAMMCLKRRMLRLTKTQLLVILVIFGVMWWKLLYLWSAEVLNSDHVSFKWNSAEVTIENHEKVVLKGNLGETFPGTASPRHCPDDPNSLCTTWSTIAKTKVKQYKDRDATCYDIFSESYSKEYHPTDCFDVSDSHWYGGAETFDDRWPMKMKLRERPYVTTKGKYGSVMERYWFSNKGIAIFVDNDVPLFVQADGKKFCLCGKYDGTVFQNWDLEYDYLKYTICVQDTVKDVHLHMLKKYIAKPTGIPDEKMLKYPKWSTWAKYKAHITQEQIIQYTDEILEHGFPACQIELDDIYTINYGDYIFDPKKFPDPKTMIDYIHSIGFRFTTWIVPFSNNGTAAFKEGVKKGYFATNDTHGYAKWYRGYGGGIDFTNKEAVDWLFHRLKTLRDLGVDGHKYDNGEIGFLPAKFKTKKRLKNPNDYVKFYAEATYNNSNNFMQVRVGYKTQHLPIPVTIRDRDTAWGYKLGVKSLITSSLLFSSIGYYFIMPDMIGGNGAKGDNTDMKPERELFIRWTQLNAFLPMMQFSFTPWYYDENVVQITRHFVTVHAEYVTPKVISLAKESVKTGYPIIRPMWWVAPQDPTTHDIDSQFMVGDDLLVAPILEKGNTSRDVYLPRGKWKDMNSGTHHTVVRDGHFIKGVKVTIEQIPYYERVLE